MFSCIEREDTRVAFRIHLVACRLDLVVICICTEESLSLYINIRLELS